MATVAQPFEPKGFDLFSSNQPTLVLENGTNFPVSGYLFDTVGEKFYRRFSAYAYLSGNVTVRIRWYSETGQTTGNVRWDAAIAAISAGDAQSVLTKALATATNTTTTVNGTARGITTTDVTVSNLDSLAADDEVWLAISLGAATMTGGAVIASVEVIYASTAGTGAGNVSNAGSSTDNAITRWDGTTGQVVQDSGVTIDDSNNITGVTKVNELTPQFIGFARLTSAFTSSGTTLQDITGLSISTPSAGTYVFEFDLFMRSSETANTIGLAVNATGGTISGFALGVYHGTNATATTNAFTSTNNTATGAAAHGSSAADFPTTLLGSFVCTASGAVVARLQKNTGGTATVQVGSLGRVFKIA